MEISFCDLRQKEVVNVCDGKRLGRVIDMVISLNTCKVLGVVVPGNRKIFNTREDVFIPWRNIQKIGADVLLVQLTVSCREDLEKCSKNKQKPISKTPVLLGADEACVEGVDFTLDDE